jgi:hypothetical protein
MSSTVKLTTRSRPSDGLKNRRLRVAPAPAVSSFPSSPVAAPAFDKADATATGAAAVAAALLPAAATADPSLASTMRSLFAWENLGLYIVIFLIFAIVCCVALFIRSRRRNQYLERRVRYFEDDVRQIEGQAQSLCPLRPRQPRPSTYSSSSFSIPSTSSSSSSSSASSSASASTLQKQEQEERERQEREQEREQEQERKQEQIYVPPTQQIYQPPIVATSVESSSDSNTTIDTTVHNDDDDENDAHANLSLLADVAATRAPLESSAAAAILGATENTSMPIRRRTRGRKGKL